MSHLRLRLALDLPGFSLKADLDLPGRGITAICGPSGSGKTSLLRAVAGLARAQGSVRVNGDTWQDDAARVWLAPHRRPLGYVFQDAALFPHLDVRANLAYGQKRVPRDQRRVSLEHAVDLLGIGSLLARDTGQLSGGERQRVAIARALATSPRLLLMDEPLSGLDPARKQEILPYLRRLRADLDIPVLYVSHAPDEVAQLADHLVVLDRGQVAACGELAEVLARPNLPGLPGDEASAVLEAQVDEVDKTWHLTKLAFAGGELWVRNQGLPLDAKARVRILARDVSLAREASAGTSILNSLPATVEAVEDGPHPALALVRLRVGQAVLWAQVTKRSAHALELAPGQHLHAQVKAAAVLA